MARAGAVLSDLPNHLVLPLEALTSWPAGAVFHWTEVGACVGVYVGVGVEKILRLEGGSSAARNMAAEDTVYCSCCGRDGRIGAVFGRRVMCLRCMCTICTVRGRSNCCRRCRRVGRNCRRCGRSTAKWRW